MNTKALALYALLLGLFLSFYTIDDRYFFHNEGVTIQCAKMSVIDLLHPGKYQTLGCSYDHQPLYSLFVNLVLKFNEVSPFTLRFGSAIFYSLGLVFFVLWLTTYKLSSLLIILATNLLATTPFLLYETLQARLYGLFFLTAMMALYLGRLYEQGRLKFRWLFIAHLLGYLNFFLFIVLTLFQFILLQRKRFSFKSKESLGLYVIGLFVLFKLPYIFWWRLDQRTGPDWWPIDLAFKEFFINPFVLVNSDPYSFVLSIVLVVTCILCVSINYWRKNQVDLLNLILLIFPVLFFLIFFFVFSAHEITMRYFIYVWPLLILNLVVFFQTTKMRRPIYSILVVLMLLLSLINYRYYLIWPFRLQGHSSPEINLEMANVSVELAKKEGGRLVITSNETYLFENYILPYIQQFHRDIVYLPISNPAEYANYENIYFYYMKNPLAHDVLGSYFYEKQQMFSNFKFDLNDPLWSNVDGSWPYIRIYNFQKR